MEFRRSGGRDERRRRVLPVESLAEEATAGEAAASTGGRSATRTPAEYSAEAKASRQLRLSDLVPRSRWLVTLLAFLAMLTAAGIVAAAWYVPHWHWLDISARATFTAGARGNLASWFASLLMLLCAGGALQIYLLRRHKIDDYRGRYRLWLPMAALFVLASADAVTGLNHLAACGLGLIVPASWNPGPKLLAVGIMSLLLASVGVRLAVETRRSRGTLAALVLSGGCYLAAAVGFVRPESAALAGVNDAHAAEVSILALLLAGHVTLLLSIMLFARYVHLAANGLLKLRPPKARPAKKAAADKKKPEDDAASEEPSSQRRSRTTRKSKTEEAPASPSTSKPAAVKSSPPASRKPAGHAGEDESAPSTLSLEELAQRDNLSDADTSHLSKAERRRLRKLQRRSKRAA